MLPGVIPSPTLESASCATGFAQGVLAEGDALESTCLAVSTDATKLALGGFLAGRIDIVRPHGQ